MQRIVIAIMLMIAAAVWGTDYTSTQDGAWSAAATWGGGGVPGNGDRAIINHAVTMSGTVTVGESPVSFTGAGSTDPGIDIILGASLTLAEDAVIYVRGDIKMLGTIVMGAGSILELDASQAATPASTVYRLCVETSWDHRDETWIQINGTAVKR
ncbi:hypothetical protein ACFL4W_02015, partial [Planctomycetota bacterium]